MRRRWLLILSGVAVIGMSTMLALALLMPRGQFRFLREHEQLPLDASAVKFLGSAVDSHRYYSFPADYPALVKKAREELEPLGYRAWHASADLTAFRNAGRQEIYLWKDLRLSKVTEWDMRGRRPPEASWVFVHLSGFKTLSFWERMKAVFGL